MNLQQLPYRQSWRRAFIRAKSLSFYWLLTAMGAGWYAFTFCPTQLEIESANHKVTNQNTLLEDTRAEVNRLKAIKSLVQEGDRFTKERILRDEFGLIDPQFPTHP